MFRITPPLSASRYYDQTTRKDNPALALAAKLRKSAQWQRVRWLHLSKYPLCCDPFGHHDGRPEPATQVHHIEGVAVAPRRVFDMANLASVCAACHRRVEAREQAGEPTAGLFRASAQGGGANPSRGSANI